MILLSKKGADTEWQYTDGKTCLVVAIEGHNEEVIRLLFAIGADIKSANNYFTYLKTSSHIKKILNTNGALFTIRDERYQLKEPSNICIGWTIIGIGNLNFDESTVALRTGLNLSFTPIYRININNEVFFVYKGEGKWDIMDIVYAPTIRYYFAPKAFYIAGGVEFTRNISYSLASESKDNNSNYDSDFGINKSTLSNCFGLGMEHKKISLELRYTSDMGYYYSHINEKQKSLYLLFGLKF